MTAVKGMILEYSLDRGETWIRTQPEEQQYGDMLVGGENTIKVNANSKNIMIRKTYCKKREKLWIAR